MRRTVFPVIGVLLGLTCVAWMAHAQEEAMDADFSRTGFRGTIASTESGNPPVPNATVQYTGAEDSGEVTAGKTGEFEISGIRPGTYLMSVSSEKYKTRTSIPVTVVSGAMTPTEVKLRRRETLVTFAGKFGWVGVPLLLCSVGAVTFIIERLWAYSRLNSGREELTDQVYNALSQDNVMEAIQACEEQSTPMANVLKAGLLRYNQGLVSGQKPSKADLQETMQEGAMLEIPEYERNLTWLSMIAVVAPLFGLLGTVMGMIKSFTVIALEGTNDPNALAGGISEALYTTAGGLTIAAPTLVFYAIFENIVNSSTMQIEVAATDTVNALMSSDRSE